MHKHNFVKFYRLVLKILSGNKILMSIKGCNSVPNLRKMTGNNPNLDLVNMNACIKFGEILLLCSQDIGLNKILMSIKGHNSVTKLRKMACNNPNIALVNINIYTKYSQNLSICSKDIEMKRNSNINQGL